MATPWTLERRQRQAEQIRRWKASRNAWQGGHLAQLRALSKALNVELAEMRRFNSMALA